MTDIDTETDGRTGDDRERVAAGDRERELGCRVAIVSGVNPDFGVLEMSFDEYVQKPFDETELRETVARLARLRAFDDGVSG